MIARAVVVWVAILVLASLNGAAREAWLVPRTGGVAGRVLSTLLLSALILLVTWLTIGWIAPGTRSDALLVGGLWLILTLMFEFLAGHYLFHQPWAALLEDYDITRGRIWVIVVLWVFLAPLAVGRLRSLI